MKMSNAKKQTKKETTKKEPVNHTTVKDCTFIGVKVDSDAAKIIGPIAEGLVETAKGLATLARLLTGHQVEIDSMIKISPLDDDLVKK